MGLTLRRRRITILIGILEMPQIAVAPSTPAWIVRPKIFVGVSPSDDVHLLRT